MKTLLVTAYDMNPYKGSESGTSWNFKYQLSKYKKLIVITEKIIEIILKNLFKNII